MQEEEEEEEKVVVVVEEEEEERKRRAHALIKKSVCETERERVCARAYLKCTDMTRTWACALVHTCAHSISVLPGHGTDVTLVINRHGTAPIPE